MIRKIVLISFLFLIINCGNEMYVEVPNNNQPIRDLVDNDKTSSTSNTYRQPSSVSSTNSSGAVGGTTSGAVGTPQRTQRLDRRLEIIQEHQFRLAINVFCFSFNPLNYNSPKIGRAHV